MDREDSIVTGRQASAPFLCCHGPPAAGAWAELRLLSTVFCLCTAAGSPDAPLVDSSHLPPEADSEDPLGEGKGSAVCAGEDPPAGVDRWMVVGAPFPNRVGSH